MEDLADRIEMAIKYSQDEGPLTTDDGHSARTFSATGSFAYYKPESGNERPGLPEIPQPGTQEYREYFEKYGHIIRHYRMMIVTVTQNGYQLDSRVISVN